MPKAKKIKGKAKAEPPAADSPRFRAKPYRWDKLGERISDADGWAKTNKRDKQKSDLMALRLASGEFNILPPELYCDRCKHARWPCIYPRGTASACCNGCSHSKLRCTRSLNPTPLVIELTKQGYCNVDRKLAKRNSLPTPPNHTPSGSQASNSTSSASPPTQAVTPALTPDATPGATPTPTPLPRVILRVPSYILARKLEYVSHTEETEEDASEVEASVAPRTPVLPRGTAEPSRHLPPLATLSRAVTPERGVASLPAISQPVTRVRRPFRSLPPVSRSATPEHRPTTLPPSHHSRSTTPETPVPAPSKRPSVPVITDFPSPPGATRYAHFPGHDSILLRPGEGRVPFLIPYAPNEDDARLVNQLRLSPTYMWRSSEPCVACSHEDLPSLFGNVYVPKQGWGIVRAPPCLRCAAVGRTCTWRVHSNEGFFATSRLNFVVLDSPGATGTGVFVKTSDIEAHSHDAIVEALHRGEGEVFDGAWYTVLPTLLNVWEQYELGTPDGETDAPLICIEGILAEDRRPRPKLAEVVQALRGREVYNSLMASDVLRRIPSTENAMDAGLLRSGDEWAAWSFANGELVLYFRDTPFYREWDTKELEKLFLGGEPRYVKDRDVPFMHWPPPGPSRLPVMNIEVRALNVEFVDMAPAMLHAVECALAGTELPEGWEWNYMKLIRERHRSLLADDAERGAALYELFRADRAACEHAVQLAALSPGIIQLN